MSDTPKPYSHPYSQAAQLDPRITNPRPIIDPVLAPLVDSFLLPEEMTPEYLQDLAAGGSDNTCVMNADLTLKTRLSLQHMEYLVSGSDRNQIPLSVILPMSSTQPLPAIFFIHGGGMVSGNRFNEIPAFLDLLDDLTCIVVSIEYHLSPETRAPGTAEDCYASLL